MSDLIHLVYSSIAVRLMTEPDLIDLLNQSREKNRRLDITGMLLYQKQTFLQVLEGAQLVVEDLFRSIIRDQRHYDVTLLVKKPINEREYPTWSMKFTNLDLLNLSTVSGYQNTP